MFWTINRMVDGKVVTVERCCYGYYKVGGICIECPNGLFGFSCSGRCTYPLYGKDCASKCNCTKQRCNHLVGCTIPGQSITKADNPSKSTTADTFDRTTVSNMYITDTETQESETHRSTVLRHVLLYGLPCVLSAFFIVIGLWFIKKKVMCTISWKEHTPEGREEDTNPYDKYEMIDESLIAFNTTRETQQQIIENPTVQETGNDNATNDENVRNSRKYLEIISENDPINNDCGHSDIRNSGYNLDSLPDYDQILVHNYDYVDDVVNVLISASRFGDSENIRQSKDYLDPIPTNSDQSVDNAVPVHFASIRILTDSDDYNDADVSVSCNDDYLHPYNTLESDWQNKTHVYSVRRASDSEKSEQVFLEPRDEQIKNKGTVNVNRNYLKDVSDNITVKYQNTSP